MRDESRAIWRKSSYSNGSGGDCVEVAALPQGIGVRDSKDRTGPVLTFTADDWRAFTIGVRDGEFDLA